MTTKLVPLATAALSGDVDPYTLYLNSFSSKETRRTMRGCLNGIASLMAGQQTSGHGKSWEVLRYEHTTQIRAKLIESGIDAATVNKHLSALRGVLKLCLKLRRISHEDCSAACSIPNVKYHRQPTGRHIPIAETQAAIGAAQAQRSHIGTRNAAIIAVLHSTGLRRGELVSLTMGCYNATDKSLLVIGKGNKERFVYLTDDAQPILEEWLAIRGRTAGPIFIKIGRYGYVTAKTPRSAGMAGSNIGSIVAKHGGFQPHDYRRTFVGSLLDAGVDLSTVQGLVGHASPVTTARYDRRPEALRARAVNLLPSLSR